MSLSNPALPGIHLCSSASTQLSSFSNYNSSNRNNATDCPESEHSGLYERWQREPTVGLVKIQRCVRLAPLKL